MPNLVKIRSVRRVRASRTEVLFAALGSARKSVTEVAATATGTAGGSVITPPVLKSFRRRSHFDNRHRNNDKKGQYRKEWLFLFKVEPNTTFTFAVTATAGRETDTEDQSGITSGAPGGLAAGLATIDHPPASYTIQNDELDYFLAMGGTDAAVGTDQVTLGGRTCLHADWDSVFQIWWAEFSAVGDSPGPGTRTLVVSTESGDTSREVTVAEYPD